MRMSEAVKLSAYQLKTCLLCGSTEPGWVGAFIPDEPRLWPGGAMPVQPEKTRAIFYLLCPGCQKRPGVAAAVEEKLAAEGLPQ